MSTDAARLAPKDTAAPTASEPPFEVVDLTPENIARLTTKYIRRYETRLERARNPKSTRSYNVPELFQRLRVWSSIREKQHQWVDLVCCEKTQVIEAIEAGE